MTDFPLTPIWDGEGWGLTEDPYDWAERVHNADFYDIEQEDGMPKVHLAKWDTGVLQIGVYEPYLALAEGDYNWFVAPNQTWEHDLDDNGDWAEAEPQLVCLAGNDHESQVIFPDHIISTRWDDEGNHTRTLTTHDGVSEWNHHRIEDGIEMSPFAISLMLDRIAERATTDDAWTWFIEDELVPEVVEMLRAKFGEDAL